MIKIADTHEAVADPIHRQPIENESVIKARERRIAEARSLTLFSDVFMTVALKDKAACQHVLRVLTGIKTLIVKEGMWKCVKSVRNGIPKVEKKEKWNRPKRPPMPLQTER